MRAMAHSLGQSEASIRPLVANERPGQCIICDTRTGHN